MSDSTRIEPVGLTIDDACAFTSLGRTSIFQAIQEGRLEAKKYGHRTIILREAAQAFLASLPSRHDPIQKTSAARD
jgi:hypothetical protein